MKHFKLLTIFLLSVFGVFSLQAQTNPTAQSLPYTQDFSTLTGSTTTYPAGFQGWTVTGSMSTTLATAAPAGDQALAAGTNASTSAGVFDMVGKMGLLSTGSNIRAIGLAINTSSNTNILVSYTVGTQAQINAGRIDELNLQYRVGTTGSFTTIAGTTYSNNATSTINTGTGATNTATVSVTLPAACEGVSNLQLRWIYRDVSGSGNRPSFSIDDISITAVASTIAISNGTIAAANINNGQTNVVLQRYDMAVTSANANLTGLTVTTSGTYAAADLTNLKCWYQTSATFNAGTATLLSTKTTSLGFGTQVFPSFVAQSIASGSTGYIFITADIAVAATNGNTINIGSTGFSNITFSSGTKTGTDPVAAGGVQTIVVAVPNISLSSPVFSNVNISLNTTNTVLYRFDLAITNSNASLTGVTINTLSGTNTASDLTNLKCWYQNNNTTFNAGTATLLSTKTTGLTAGLQVFPSFIAQSITSGTTASIFITADLPLTATINNTIVISAITTSDITFASGNKTGTSNGSGTQTIIDCTPVNITSGAASSANGSSVLTWTNPSCFDEVLIVASTAANTGTPTGDGSAYVGNLTYGSGTALGNGFIVYKGFTSSQIIAGLTNGTQYFFKFFTRRGSIWSIGTEINATPSLTGYFWNGGTISANPAAGGTGSWGTANAWRQPTSVGSQGTWADNNNAIFSGTAGTVTLDASRITSGIYFNISGYNLITTSPTGVNLTGSITLGNNVGLVFSPNVNTTTPASGTIGIGNVTGSGTANITINSAQSTTASAQRLNLATANSSISVPINITSAGGSGTASIAQIAATSAGAVLTSAATITNNTAIKTGIGATSGNDITVNGVITGSADLIFAAGTSGGAGMITLNAENNFTGATIFNAANSCVVKLGINNALPTTTDVTMANSSSNGGILDLMGYNQTVASLSSGAGGGSIRNNGTADATLTINGSTSTIFGLPITDGTTNKIALVKSGSSTLTLSGVNTYTGGTTINSGILQLGTTGVLSDVGAITLNGGTLASGASTGFTETMGTLNVNANSTIALGTGNHTLTFANSSAVTWAASTLTITGWNGAAGSSGTGGKIIVGTGGLNSSQLSKIIFTGYTGNAVIVAGELVPAPSSNADLTSLIVSSGTLSPTFASGTTAYTDSVTNATASITVTPTRSEANATIEVRVNGGTYASVTSGSASASLALNVGNNTIEVRVTAQDGTTQKTYTITVTRIVSPILNNSIADDQNICSGSVPSSLIGSTPTGGDGTTYTYLWLSSTTSATTGFAAASGTNNAQNYSPGSLTQTTWYRRYVVSGAASDTSGTVKVTVNTAVATNTISSSPQTICSGSTTDSLTASTPTGGDGTTYTYSWLSSTTSATTGFAAASGINNTQNYSPGSLTANTWYRRVVSSGVCSADTTTAITITVNSPVASNTVTGTQTICSGLTPALLTGSTPTGGDGATYTYSWLSSTTSATAGFAAASGTNNTQNYSPGSLTANTWYRRVVSSGVCSADTTTAVAITVNSPVASNTVTGTQTICSGLTPASLTASTPTGGDGTTYTYTWLSSTSSATTGFAAASGTNNTQNYTPGSLTANTWYRRRVSSGVCNADTSAAVAVTVNPVIAGNTIGSNQSIVSGTTPAGLTGALPTGGTGTYTYTWLVSTTSATAGFSAIASSNTQNYSPGSLTANTWYRRLVVSGSCSDTSSAVAISVISAIANNTISGASTICSGSTPTGLSGALPTGATGTYTYLWLSSTTSATAGFAAASGTNNTQNYSPGSLTQTTWFRRYVVSGAASDTSSAVTVTVNPVIAGNTVGSNQSILSGATPTGLTGALPTGGNSTYTYTWLVSTTSATAGFSAIASSNTQNYSPGALTVNTWYRRLVVSGSCSDTSSAVAITITSAIANNTISGASIICSGTTPTGLTGALPTGGTGTYTYTWLSSITSATTGFAAASGTNNAQNYSPGALTVSTWYRRYVVSGAASDTSVAVKVTVNTAVATNTISSSPQTICSGSTPASLTASTPTGGDGTTYTYTWLSSTSSATTGFAAASGTNNTQNYSPGSLTANTWYRRRVSSGVCSADTTTAITITVNSPVASNIVTGTQTICSGSTPALLTASTPTGGDGTTYTYSWLSSTTSATAGFAAASGTNNTQNYSPGSLTANTWYRRVVSSGVCSADTTTAITITVNSPVASNTVTGTQTICSGLTPALLTGSTPTGGDGATYTYSWLSSTTSATAGFAAASGTNNTQNYSSGALTQNTWYKRVVISGVCSADTTTAVAITVNSSVTSNTTTGTQTICSGSTPASLTASTPTGGDGTTYTYTWLSSTSSATIGFAAASGTNNTQNYTPSALTANTWYRRRVSSGVCNADTSAAVAVTVNPVIAGNTIGSNQSIVSGTTPAGLTGALPTGGNSTYTYTWLVSTTSATAGFSAIASSNTQNYSPGSLTVNTWYRRVVVSGSCSDTSSAVAISVIGAIANNTISGASTICTSSTPTGLSGALPTGATGTYTYLWLSSTTSATAGFAAASGTNNTQNYSPGSLTQTTWFRRYVVSGAASDTSAAVTVTVNTPGVWGGTVSTAWNNIANWTCPQIPTSTTNVSIGSGATNMPTITDAQQCNNLTINSGATLTLTGASAQLNIFGSFTNNGTFTNTSTGKTVFSGSAQQTVPAGNYTKLQINNAAGVVLGGAVTLSDSLVLSNGTITLGANNLTLGTTSYASVGNASSYIKTNGAGSVIVNGVGSTGKTGNVIIPVGNTTYNPATLLNTGTTDNFTIRLFDSVTTNYTGSAATGAKLTSNALNRTWIINEGTAGGSNATVTLQWNTADELSGFTRALCYVARYNGTVWTSTTATAATGSNPYTQTRSGITSFSPFSVGSGGTLPVELIVFAGTRKSEKSYLRWATASETNNDYFIVERSLDNKVFEPIGQRIKGQGNSNSVNQYESVDADAMNYALVNRSSTVYYRLRQVDFDGTVNYSKSISVLFDDGFIIFNATVSPNPFDGSVQLNVTTNNESVAQIEIVDIKGLVVYSEKLNLLQENSNYVLNNLDQLAEGMYFIKVKQGIDVKVIKVIRTNLVK